MKRFREGLIFKAHRLVYHSILGVRVMNKKQNVNRAHNLLPEAVVVSLGYVLRAKGRLWCHWGMC